MKKFVLAILLALPVLLLGGCGEEFDTYEDPSLEEILETGKAYLEVNQGSQGAEAFREAYKRYPESLDASYGLILGNTMGFVNLVDELIALVGDMLLTAPAPPATGEPGVVRQELDANFGDELQGFFEDLVTLSFEENERHYLILEAADDFDFDLNYYPVVFAEEALLSFGGQFDRTDMFMFGAVTSLISFVSDILLAHDINFDFNMLFGSTGEPAAGEEPEEGGSILDTLEEMLTDPEYPDFLYVKGPEGLELMKSAGVNLGNTFDRAARMLGHLRQESDYQYDDQIRYLDLNKDNHYNAMTEPVFLGSLATLDPGLAPVLEQLFADLSLAFWEGSVADPHPFRKDTFNLGMLNGLLIYLGVLETPFLPEWIGLDVGSFFSDPSDDGLRTLLFLIIDLIDFVSGQLDN